MQDPDSRLQSLWRDDQHIRHEPQSQRFHQQRHQKGQAQMNQHAGRKHLIESLHIPGADLECQEPVCRGIERAEDEREQAHHAANDITHAIVNDAQSLEDDAAAIQVDEQRQHHPAI